MSDINAEDIIEAIKKTIDSFDAEQEEWEVSREIMEEEFREPVEHLISLAGIYDVPLHITIEHGAVRNENGNIVSLRNTTHLPGSRPSPIFDDMRRVTIGRELVADVVASKMLEVIDDMQDEIEEAQEQQQQEEVPFPIR